MITQYNERSPDQVVARARQRVESDWQHGHYDRLLAHEAFAPDLVPYLAKL